MTLKQIEEPNKTHRDQRLLDSQVEGISRAQLLRQSEREMREFQLRQKIAWLFDRPTHGIQIAALGKCTFNVNGTPVLQG